MVCWQESNGLCCPYSVTQIVVVVCRNCFFGSPILLRKMCPGPFLSVSQTRVICYCRKDWIDDSPPCALSDITEFLCQKGICLGTEIMCQPTGTLAVSPCTCRTR